MLRTGIGRIKGQGAVAESATDVPDRKLASIHREVAKAEGRRQSLTDRLTVLTDDVGRAKGRVMLKADIDDFLEDIQATVLQKAVGSYSRLLTALANDVLRTDDKIGLDLYTERGLPALDVFVDAEGGREDIINGTGGSMTNIMSLGLRMIATVRSGMRKFVALDEPDCWIAPSRVPNFYKVIDDLSDKLDVQSLIISHHDIDLMPEGFAIAKLYKENGKVVCENDPKAASWTANQTGIRRLRLVNFMSHEDTEIKLAPGATAIIGQNHLGKSVSVRSLRAVAYGEVSDADIRHGQKMLSVEIEIEGNRVVRLTRQMGRNPVNEWTLEDLEGNILVDEANRTEYRTGGRSVPEWVPLVLGIEKFEGLEHQLSHQKFPVFLLGETASKRASVLSIGRESGYVQKMIARQKENAKKDAATIKNGEKEVATIMDELKKLDGFEDIAKSADQLSEDLEEIKATSRKVQQMEALLSKIEGVSTSINNLTPKVDALKGLPSAPSIEANIQKRNNINTLGANIAKNSAALQTAKKTSQILSENLPDIPELADASAVDNLVSRVISVSASKDDAEKSVTSTAAELQQAENELASAVESMGGACPLCNANIEHVHEMV